MSMRREKDPYYTVAQVAERLKVSQRSVRRWIADGRLSVHRFGRTVRIAETDLLEFEVKQRNGNSRPFKSL